MKKQIALLAIFAFSSLAADWAEERLRIMTLDEKIGQLFIVPACPLRGSEHLRALTLARQKYHVGAVILKQGEAAGQIMMIRWLQTLSNDPLLCVGDAEWGLGMRLTDTLSFPRNLTLGAIQNRALIYELGKEIGQQCKKVGLHVNLAPVVDVNCNPQNPIIHTRSFGENPEEVAARAALIVRGMQENGVAGCAKHFIGHGDTTVDSHVDLPMISHAPDRLRRIELYPFQKMIEEGIFCVMTGHLFVPFLDPEKPVTFSPTIVQKLLQQEMGFKGLVISDALNMQGISQNYPCEMIAKEAFLAGHDLLLYGDHIAPQVDEILDKQLPAAFQAIKAGIEDRSLSLEELDRRVLKILKFKQSFSKDLLTTEDLSSTAAKELKRRLFREALTLLKNDNTTLPLSLSSKVALVKIGESRRLEESLLKYTDFQLLKLEQIAKLEERPVLIFAVSKVTPELCHTIATLTRQAFTTILILFGSPYSLQVPPECSSLIVAYEKDPDCLEAVADLLFGKLEPKGRLPVSVIQYPRGSGIGF